jgi:hypothetical protein
MSPLRLNGSTSGYSQLDAPAIAGDQTFTLPGTGGTIDRLNRAGNILQVVQGSTTTLNTSSSTTYADTGLTASITPTSSSSKILILANHSSCGKISADTALRLRLMRDATQLAITTGSYTGSTVTNFSASSVIEYLDSPATTSTLTYKTQFATSVAGTVYIQSDSSISTITLMEVAA